jgi:hypothetical protein
MLYIPDVDLTEAEASDTSRGPVSSDNFESFLDNVESYDTIFDSRETSREILETGRVSVCLEALDSFEQALNWWATEDSVCPVGPSHEVGCALDKRENVRKVSKKPFEGRLRSLSENSLRANSSVELERTGTGTCTGSVSWPRWLAH